MAETSLAEIYFIAGMMVVILIICIAATYIFIRQYRREKARGGSQTTDNQARNKNIQDEDE
ncbi:MAG: hypothetical protein R2684_10950 [Pyrinomonadaceae bacterium]